MPEDLKRHILQLIARHDGQWSWYQMERALLGMQMRRLSVEMKELAVAGLIAIRPDPVLSHLDRYWLTDKERAAIHEDRGQDP